jgi:hypothetical protein
MVVPLGKVAYVVVHGLKCMAIETNDRRIRSSNRIFCSPDTFSFYTCNEVPYDIHPIGRSSLPRVLQDTILLVPGFVGTFDAPILPF